MSVPLCPYPVWVLFLKLKLKLRVAQPTSWGPTEPTRYRSLAEGLCCRELAEAAPGEPTRGNRHISMIHVRDPRYSQAGEGARPTYERNEGPILEVSISWGAESYFYPHSAGLQDEPRRGDEDRRWRRASLFKVLSKD